MQKNVSHARIYKAVADLLDASPLVRERLIENCTRRMGLSDEEMLDNSAGSAKNVLRSRIGTVINDMHSKGLIGLDDYGKYYLVSARPVVVRIEKCEKEILKALSQGPMSKGELREHLQTAFGTDKTVTTRDDDIVSTYMGQILKRMLSEGIILILEGVYSLSPKISARADDINELLTLKSDFISRIHSKGGEFFENYFMTLLSKYCAKHDKRILECYVTGGSADGGIDGVLKTEDSLGFREVTMVQTKNRVEISSETDVRGFYGAVCAKKGTRGIFATTSDFHSGARAFLDSLDDCIGIGGDKLFSMAIECAYGIRLTGNKYEIDNKVLAL